MVIFRPDIKRPVSDQRPFSAAPTDSRGLSEKSAFWNTIRALCRKSASNQAPAIRPYTDAFYAPYRVLIWQRFPIRGQGAGRLRKTRPNRPSESREI
jgi:hypothetical protein